MTERKSGKVIRITDTCILGREGDVEADFFTVADKDRHVSRKHCKVIYEKGEYKIEHLSDKNPTMIDNVPLGKVVRRIIRNCNSLTLADMTFDILIEVPLEAKHEEVIQEAAVSSTNTEPDKTRVKYIVTCPKCGAEYEVANSDDTINECDHCDEYDRHKIARIRAGVKYAN